MSDNFKLALTFATKVSEGKKNFDGINLAGAMLNGLSTHEGSSLNRAVFRECQLVSAVMSGLSLKSTAFDAADLQGAVFVGSNCQRATFTGANLCRVNFSKSRLCGANFSQANLQGANFRQADMRGANFRGAMLSQAEFRGAFYDETTLFDSSVNPDSLGMRNTTQAKSKNSKPDSMQKSKTQIQQREITYRGVRTKKVEGTPTSAPSTASQPKEIFYRGARVNHSDESVQVRDSSEKPGLTYRGVKL